MKDSRIPEKFYNIRKLGHYPFASTIGELKQILSELPDDLAIDEDNFGIVIVSVANNTDSIESHPSVIFEMDNY